MRQQFFYLYILLAVVLALTGCSRQQPRYIIGVSQCSGDIWRDKQNAEMRMGAYFQENVELRFASAYDNDQRQIEQIDSLVASGIQLLIVAPNQVATISPAIDRAFDRGVPVIVFERKSNSPKYTAFISADNYEMGKVMGEHVVRRLQGRGHVLEIKGLEGSSPSIERHKGFLDALKSAPGIEVVDTLQGDWTEPTAFAATKQWLAAHPDVSVDLVFGHNDRSAIGARRAFLEVRKTATTIQKPLYCGIDGLPGENGGIRLVRDSILDASYIYPTHGDRLLQLAVDILDGKPYHKETMLMSALVTHDNAKVLLMQTDELMRQAAQLDQLHQKADNYLHKLDAQRAVTWLAVGIIALLIIVFVLFYLYHLSKVNLQRNRVVNTLWNMNEKVAETATQATAPVERSEYSDYSEFFEYSEYSEHSEKSEKSEKSDTDSPGAQKPASSPALPGSPAKPGDAVDHKPVSAFITRFKEVVESRLTDSELSVEDLAADMNLSRVQLYRKVKAISGSTPIELLRSARLSRAYQMLITTDKTVSEVAYEVGFTAPSYFTKCFKDEYGLLPGEVRK